MPLNSRELYYSGQEVLVEDLSWAQTAYTSQDRSRISDLWTDGVLNDPNGLSNMTVSIDATTNTLFNVTQGTAYSNGNRIAIDSDQAYDATGPTFTTNGICTPRSTGNKGIPLADYTLNKANYIWAEYLSALNTGRKSVSFTDASIHYPQEQDGYQIVVTTTNNPGNPIGITNSVYLATIFGQGAGQPLSSNVVTGLTDISKLYSHIRNNLSIATGTVRGSTANSGGVQQEIQQGTISTPDLRDLAVGTSKLSDSSVSSTKLASLSVTSAKLQAETIFGSGSDGIVTISSNTVINGTKNYQDLTINAGVTLTHDTGRAMYLNVTDTLTVNGSISADGKGSLGGAGGHGGSGGGGVGGAVSLPGSSATRDFGRTYAAGGGGGGGGSPSSGTAGSPGGFGGYPLAMDGTVSGIFGNFVPASAGLAGGNGLTASFWFTDLIGLASGFEPRPGIGGGGGGGGSGGGNISGGAGGIGGNSNQNGNNGVDNAQTGGGGGGGGGGSGGGVIIISAKNIIVGASGQITANGLSGGNAGNGGNGTANIGGSGGGGGGGGSGGNLIMCYRSLTNSGTISANGGMGGTGGISGTSGIGNGNSGGNGGNGGNGVLKQIQIVP